eukprot:scaffold1.g5406.t1
MLCLDSALAPHHPPYLGQGGAWPPRLRHLDVAGLVGPGLERVVGQLDSLTWTPGEMSEGFEIDNATMRLICQATRLTQLSFASPEPINGVGGFLQSLGTATHLRSLDIGYYPMGHPTFLSPERWPDPAPLLGLLGGALARLTRLTTLELSGHDLPAAPPALAALPTLHHLNLQANDFKELPRGPWPSLESLAIDDIVAQAALAALPGAPAGADAGAGGGGHALWALAGLTSLHADGWRVEWEEVGSARAKAAIRERLPRLRELVL